MEEAGLAISENGNEEKALKGLIDTSGAMLSHEAIASANGESVKGADADAPALSNMPGGASSTDPDANCMGGNADKSDDLSSQSSFPDMSQKPTRANGNSNPSKLKHAPVAIGTVSTFLGKDYVRSQPSSRRLPESTKPLKLDPEVLPMSALWVDEDKVQTKADQLHKEMEDFLFKMLGEGFQLDRDLIGDVLGKCGYDMQKSMEKLFKYSASSLDKGTRQELSLKRLREVHTKQDRHNLQKEVLAALFTSGRHEEETSSPAVEKSAACSTVVRSTGNLVEYPEKSTVVDESTVANSKQDNNDDDAADEEDSYQALRKAVQEHRNTMKDYYTAATEAFQTGNQVRAYKLLEKGLFFQQKARLADEKSAEKIFETGNSKDEDTEDSMTLNLHEYDPREATRLLKQHLSSLASNPAFKYLKVIIETADEDSSKGARGRRIMKLLERESLEWTEGGTAGTILIPLENINRQSLSFVKK
ncbi:hypothetical protein CDL15_Pgr016876 [Punica granatum]|uniref:DUF1771 domain-containing protein n=1 Tax=Punica granatum TaxID=22663 RepID=A0A218WY94_PUNGR|nr:hypothetical protein CDL15_Pgr016876 [Punica granatum]